jgi:hypothetical protein
MVNRRMFRPSFADVKESAPPRPPHNGPVPSKKPAPPETTHAENFYWVKQMQSRTPMTSWSPAKLFTALSSGMTATASS